MNTFFDDVKFALHRKCPVCKQGAIFDSWLNFTPKEHCENCGARLKAQDVGDGAIVVLIFLLSFTIVPAAIVWEIASEPSLVLQLIVWTCVSLFTIFLLTPILKAYIMMLQYRHRRNDWKK